MINKAVKESLIILAMLILSIVLLVAFLLFYNRAEALPGIQSTEHQAIVVKHLAQHKKGRK